MTDPSTSSAMRTTIPEGECRAEGKTIRTHSENLRISISWAAFVLTATYVVLAHLSPAVVFPRLSHYSIMVWLGVAAALACLSLVPFHPSRWRSPDVYLMLGLTAAVPLSLAVNGLPGAILQSLRVFLAAGIVFFLVLAAVDTVRKLRLLAFAVVLAAIYLLS